MGRSLLAVASVVAAFVLAPLDTAQALYVSSTAHIDSGAFPVAVNDGGPAEPSASVSETGSYGGADFTSDVAASASASALGGHLDLDLEIATSVSTGAPFDRSGTWALGRSQATDWFHVQAGTSGLANGTPVTVELQVDLVGGVSLNGKPGSDNSEYVFHVSDRGLSGHQVEIIASPTPSGEYEVAPPRWYVTLDTTIGAHIIIDAYLRAQLGSQQYSAGDEETDRMWFQADFRLTQSAAYPDIQIDSEVGAPTEPLPPLVPLMGLPGWVLLSLALMLGGAVVATRSIRSVG